MMHRTPDVVRSGNALEDAEELGAEALGAEGDARGARLAQRTGELARDRLRVRLHRDLACGRKRREQPRELRKHRERRRAAAEEDRVEIRREPVVLEPELGEQRVDVGGMALT